MLPYSDTKLDVIFDPVLDFHSRYLERVKQHHTYQNMPSILRMKEYATVRLGFGRQLGKSSYIARSSGHRDIIYCRDIDSAEVMTKRVSAFRFSHENRVYSWKDRQLIVLGEFENIWISDASCISASALEWLYEQFADRCHRFILIG